ncbi:hypothetical protein GGR51DRAFT_523570 [Nemania sp. FL0031]|nr:hypothetical protein GGR51DRAFT_523570 [Nemania sp. FL0031]
MPIHANIKPLLHTLLDIIYSIKYYPKLSAMSTISIPNERIIGMGPRYNAVNHPWEEQPTQDISGRSISSTKLVQMLINTFGAGAYDVHVAHNSFCIKAPRKLTTDEIAECRR